jgi:hypothetical protein
MSQRDDRHPFQIQLELIRQSCRNWPLQVTQDDSLDGWCKSGATAVFLLSESNVRVIWCALSLEIFVNSVPLRINCRFVPRVVSLFRFVPQNEAHITLSPRALAENPSPFSPLP